MNSLVDPKSSIFKKSWIRYTSTAIVLIVMITIFIFSAQSQEQSEGLSFPIGDAAMDTGFFEFDLFDSVKESYAQDHVPFILFVQRLVRKLAHVFIFTILGISLRICLESWFADKKHLLLYSLIIGTAYAVSDEIHQLLVPGRSGSIQDILLDCSGVLLGALIAAGIICLVKKKHSGAHTTA